jgi:hypothetical protein
MKKVGKLMNTTFLTCFLGLFFVVGFVILGYGLRSYFKGRESLSWPTAPATLTHCEIAEKSSDDSTTWQVKVNYTYKALGTEYSGDRLAFGYSGTSSHETHEKIYAKLTGAESFYVHYKPLEPGTSVIAPGTNRSTYMLLMFGATWLLFITGFTLMMVLTSGIDNKLLNQIKVIRQAEAQTAF